MENKRKCALLIHTGGADTQRSFYKLPVIGDSYNGVLKALKECFVPKLYIITEWNKFQQRAQQLGESTAQYAVALRELVMACEFGDLSEEMI